MLRAEPAGALCQLADCPFIVCLEPGQAGWRGHGTSLDPAVVACLSIICLKQKLKKNHTAVLTQLSVRLLWRPGQWAFPILLSSDSLSWLLVSKAPCLPSPDVVTTLVSSMGKGKLAVSQSPTKTHCSSWGPSTHCPWSTDHCYNGDSEMLTVGPGCSGKDPSIST